MMLYEYLSLRTVKKENHSIKERSSSLKELLHNHFSLLSYRLREMNPPRSKQVVQQFHFVIASIQRSGTLLPLQVIDGIALSLALLAMTIFG